ncbi:endonuclease/exonuclease/phosphatase family protein [Bremerella sp. JC817]|uniref:endonuclease/exonuclease/phosphatase family protein n=1 Tax=Bremerella sp. JC817 TaxID=3231756 RepID=UPI00345A4F21
MIRSTLLPVTWVLSLVLPVAAIASEPIQIRVVSYNIHHGEGTDRKLDLKRIADTIAAAKPDIIALQEVDQNTSRTGKVDQAATLAEMLKMNSVFGGNLKLQGGQYGNAILTRYPSISMTNHRLPQVNPGEPRGVIEADIRVPGLQPSLKVLATHLDHRSHNADRIASCEEINKLTKDWGDRPALLAGDLNDVPESKALQILAPHWTQANAEPVATIPSDDPERQIDFILLRPASQWKVVEFQVLDEAVASDHLAILAVLEWTGGSE